MPPADSTDDPDDPPFPEPGESTEIIKQFSGVNAPGPGDLLHAATIPAITPARWWLETRNRLAHDLAPVGDRSAVAPLAGLDRELGTGVSEFLGESHLSWLVRGHGRGMGHSVIDALQLERFVGLVARTDWWLSKSLYPGASAFPGVAAAVAGSSVVLRMTAGISEMPVGAGEGQEYPTVAAGQYFAALIDAATSEADLIRLLSPMKRGSVRRFVSTLEELADAEIGIDAVVRLPGQERSVERIARSSISPEEATEGARILRAEPETIRERSVVVGVLGNANAFSHRFTLAPDDLSPHISGHYHPDLQYAVDAVFNRRVAATIVTTRSEHEWMPAARRPTHELIAVEESERRL